MTESECKHFFEKWFGAPLDKLEEIPEGDGAFAAMSTCWGLYERFLSTLSKEEKQARKMRDFEVSTAEQANDIWNMCRDGLAHSAMFFVKREPRGKKKTKVKYMSYEINGNFTRAFEFDTKNPNLLMINPWLFKKLVVSIYRSNYQLLVKNEGAPMPTAFQA